MGPTSMGRLRARACAAAVAILLAGLTGAALASPGPAVAAPPRLVVAVPLYAYAGGAAASPSTCPADTTHTAAVECSLSDALDLAGTQPAGDQVVELATAGASAHYVGNWAPDLSGTTAAHPMLLEAAPGLATPPVLDGNAGSAVNCPTGACDDAIFTAQGPGHVDLSGFTMTNADNTASSTGGAVDNLDATVAVASMTFTDDTAADDGGALDNGDGATGTLTVTGSTFGSDSAGSDGGAIDNGDAGTGTTTVTGSTFTSDHAGSDGGAIDSADAGTGNLTVTDSTFTSDSADTDGGAIDNADVGTGPLTVTGSTFTSDTAGSDGGAIDHADAGAGAATVTTSTFTGNTADDDGGAIDNADDSSTGPASLGVTSSTFATNTATLYDGGAIDNADAGDGSITSTVSGSTLWGNAAGSDGGAIDNGDASSVVSTVTVSRSTLTANTAPQGGAVDNAEQSGIAALVISASTVSGNSGAVTPGIDNADGTGTVDTAADLLADVCAPGTAGWHDAGYDVGDATCLAGGTGSVTSTTVAAHLSVRAANGGATTTMLPVAGNAGIGAIPPVTSVTLGTTSTALCPTTDQRGVASVPGQACSVGAVQVATPVITSSSHATFVLASPGTFSFRATGLPGPEFTETGALPAGVTLSAGGVLAGSPRTAGTFPLTVTAANSTGTAHQAFTLTVPSVPAQGYWLVGGDGGIFTYGAAHFYGSTGNLHLQRPVVAITPTASRGGYWLVASDGGIFAFGNSTFHGSIPGVGLAPAGTPGTTKRLNAPIVGMVPSVDGGGYFMVASDGGVFAFGDARFSGSCPGIGGCSGAAVSVVPDATGNGYWVVTATGNVYAFGKAPNYGSPGYRPRTPVTSAVRYPDGSGYWILFSDGDVWSSNPAKAFSPPPVQYDPANPATAVFATSDGTGYWVAFASGVVQSFGDAAFQGDPAASHLNAPIIAASGF